MVSYPWFYWLITVLNDFTCFCFPCNLILLGWDRLEKSKWRNEACLCCWSSHWAPGFQLQPFPAKWCAGLLREELWLEQRILPLGFLLQGSPRSHVLGTSAGTIFCSLSSFSLELQPCSLSASLPKLCSSCALLVPLCFPGATQAAWFELRGQGLAAWGCFTIMRACLGVYLQAACIKKTSVLLPLGCQCHQGLARWAGFGSPQPRWRLFAFAGQHKAEPVLPQRLQQGTSHTQTWSALRRDSILHPVVANIGEWARKAWRKLLECELTVWHLSSWRWCCNYSTCSSLPQEPVRMGGREGYYNCFHCCLCASRYCTDGSIRMSTCCDW